MKVNPMNPVLMQAWNKGRQSGINEATEKLAAFINERMVTLLEVPGIGEKTAWKVHEHFLKGMNDIESAINNN